MPGCAERRRRSRCSGHERRATGDVVSALVQALDDPSVPSRADGDHVGRPAQVRGRAGRQVDAIEGYLLAFRRADYAARGPLDERFRSIGTSTSGGAWSCATKGGNAPRHGPARRLPAVRHEHRGYTSLPDDERDRQSKRNFYRIIDRFGSRRDLLVHPAVASAPLG
jgi:cysteinyl-tRNA synthetase